MDRRVQVPIHVTEERMEEEPSAPESKRAVSGVQATEPDLEMWRDRALRLQAEMENFRKRQQRLAEERIAEERERLLRAFLAVVEVVQRGYRLGNRLLRPARVIVAA